MPQEPQGHEPKIADHTAARQQERTLVRAVQAGDREAFGRLVEQHSGRAYSVALGMLRNEQDARDVVQQTFLNVWRAIGGFRADASLGSWIGRIATNNALMRLRTRRRKPEEPLPELGPNRPEQPVVDWSPIADRLHENAELGRQIQAAVADLPEPYRVVVVMADYEEMSMREIAEALNISVPNVKTRLHRARMALRQALLDYVQGRA